MRHAALFACLLTLVSQCSCSPAPAGRSSVTHGPEVCFASPGETPVTASGMVDGEGLFTSAMLGKSTTLGGELFDTSAIDLFYVSVYDGFRVRRKRLYVAHRIYQEPSPVWCQVDARISKVDERLQDHDEIDIATFRPLDMDPINRALETSAAWMEANRAGIDMNRLKQAHDFTHGVDASVATLDFNRTPYVPLKEIVGVDPRRGVAEFRCGRHVLQEVKYHHGSYAEISIVYDLKARRPLRVIVDPRGYFEE